MVDHANRTRIEGLQPLSAPGVIRAIDEDRRAGHGVPQRVVRPPELHPGRQVLQAPGHGVRVHADHVLPAGGEHPGEGHLRPDAVAIRPGVPADGDRQAGDTFQQPGERRPQLRIESFHRHSFGSGAGAGAGAAPGGVTSSSTCRIRAPRAAE